MRRPIWLLALFAAGPAFADFASGLAAYQKGDDVSAAREWRPLAEQGDAASQFNIGLLYYEGQGMPQDFAEAATWFTRAAEQDYGKAQYNLGALYGVGKGVKRDYMLAYKWLNLCAAKSDNRCVAQRELVAKKLNASKLAAAQRLSTEFKPKKEPEQ